MAETRSVSPVLGIFIWVAASLLVPKAEGALVKEVLEALDGALATTDDFSFSAEMFKNLVKYNPQPLNISGKITILLPSNGEVFQHKIKDFTTPVKHKILSFHTLNGLFDFYYLKRDPLTTLVIKTKAKKSKVYAKRFGETVLFEPAPKKKIQAVRSCEQCHISAPGLYEGPYVVVHGIGCVLTPPGFEYGKLCTPDD